MPDFIALANVSKQIVQPTANVPANAKVDPMATAKVATPPVATQKILVTERIAPSMVIPAGNFMKFIDYRPIRIEPLPPKEDSTPLPIVADSQQLIFDDRFNVNKKWYLPDFEIVDPNQSFFTIMDNGLDRKGQPLFKANAILTYREVESVKFTAEKQKLLAKNSQLTFEKIPLTLQEVGVVIRYGSATRPIALPIQYGTLLPNNQVQFELSDDGETMYAGLFYENLSNYQSTNLPATFVFTITFEGWEKLFVAQGYPVEASQASNQKSVSNKKVALRTSYKVPSTVIVADNVEFTWNRKSVHTKCWVEKVISCAGGKGYFYQKAGAEALPCGCNPPWSKTYSNGIFYKRYQLPPAFQDLDIRANIFQQIAQPEIFLVIPKGYCLSLDDNYFLERMPDEYAPDIVLTSLINANPGHEGENTIQLDLILKPDLTQIELHYLTQIIMEDLWIVPQLKYPFDLGILLVKEFEETGSGLFECVEGATSFKLTFRSSEGKFPQSQLDLAQVINANSTGMSLQISYDIDQQNQQRSLLQAHLKKTVGNVTNLTLNEAKDQLTIKNHASDAIQVDGLLFYAEGQKGFTYCTLTTPLQISAKTEAVISIATDLAGQVANIHLFDKVAAQYQILEDNENLQEIRLNMDLRSVRIPVNVTGLDAAQHGITSLQVNLEIDFMKDLMQMPAPLIKNVAPVNGAFVSGDEAPFVITYPVSYDIEQAQKTMKYWVSIHYGNETQQRTKVFSQNFGDNARIVITADILKSENLANPANINNG